MGERMLRTLPGLWALAILMISATASRAEAAQAVRIQVIGLHEAESIQVDPALQKDPNLPKLKEALKPTPFKRLELLDSKQARLEGVQTAEVRIRIRAGKPPVPLRIRLRPDSRPDEVKLSLECPALEIRGLTTTHKNRGLLVVVREGVALAIQPR
jgi:hypothetical protein